MKMETNSQPNFNVMKPIGYRIHWFWLLMFKLGIIKLNAIELNKNFDNYRKLQVSLTVFLSIKWIYSKEIKICKQDFKGILTHHQTVCEIRIFFYWFKKNFKNSFIENKRCFKCGKIAIENYYVSFENISPKRCDSCQADFAYGM